MKSLEVRLQEIAGKRFEEIVNQVENAVRAEAPVLKTQDTRLSGKSGALKKSITKEKRSETSYLVGVDADKLKAMTGTDYSPYIVNGTRPHTIKAKGKKLKYMKNGSYVYAQKVRHPGSKANDFIAKAVAKLKG